MDGVQSYLDKSVLCVANGSLLWKALLLAYNWELSRLSQGMQYHLSLVSCCPDSIDKANVCFHPTLFTYTCLQKVWGIFHETHPWIPTRDLGTHPVPFKQASLVVPSLCKIFYLTPLFIVSKCGVSNWGRCWSLERLYGCPRGKWEVEEIKKATCMVFHGVLSVVKPCISIFSPTLMCIIVSWSLSAKVHNSFEFTQGGQGKDG